MQGVRIIGLAAICTALIAWSAGCGCGTKPSPSTMVDKDAIATVDGKAINAEQLLAEFETVPAERRTHYATHREELLDFIINRMVIVAEARAAGLDKTGDVMRRTEDARRFALRMMLEKEMLRSSAPITDAQLRARYREDVLGPVEPVIVKQAIVYRIPVEPVGAETILSTIEASREQHLPFGTLATRDQIRFTLVPTSAGTDTGLPPELASELGRMGVFAATDVRDVGGADFMFYREPLPFEQAAPLVRATVLKERIAKARGAWLESARSEARITSYADRLTDEAAETDVVAVVNGAAITVGDARRALERMSPSMRTRYADDAGALTDELIADELLVQEALRRGLDEQPEFAARMAGASEAILVHAMRERVLAELEATISEDELRRLAAEAAGGDLPTEFIELYAIISADRAQAAKALEELDAGSGFEEVRARYSSEENEHLGTYSDTTIDQMPEALRTAVDGLRDGEHTGVIELDGRYAVVRVSRRPAVVDLEAWRHQLVIRNQDKLFLAWVTKKRAAHEIVVNTARLEAVELPTAPAAPTGLGVVEEPSAPGQ